MAVPNNPAEALARLLRSVTQSGQNTFGNAWAVVLDAPVTSSEFVLRHSAVVGLVSEVQTYLESLPADDELRDQHLEDMPIYYGVVVYHGDWNQQLQSVAALIADTQLRLLAALGTTIKYRGVFPDIAEADVDKLRETLHEWETMLDEATLPEGIDGEIRAQLATIHELLGQADKLGYGPLVKEVETLFGKAVRVAKYVEDAKKVTACVTGLFGFLTHLHVGDYASAANVLTAGFQMMGEALQTAHTEANPMRAIESGPQVPELEAGTRSDEEAEHEQTDDTDGPTDGDIEGPTDSE